MPRTDPYFSESLYRRGPHWVAVGAALFTLPLLFVGGSVTSFGVGMAVPDWPTTFGANMFLYDFWNAPFGVKVEHTHRLYGAAVGLATIFLMVWFLAFEGRWFMKVLGVTALVAVVAQGVLGGTRVTQVSTLLAAVHGCLGQAFFGLMVALCVLTGRDWLASATPAADPAHLRRKALITLILIVAQVVLGAWFRHFGPLAALFAHAVMAAAVWGHAALLSWRVERQKTVAPALVPSARAMAFAVTLQVALGILTLWLMLPLGGNPRPPSLWQAMTRTAHQTNGALLLASAIVLTLRAFRHLRPASAVTSSPTRSAPLSLEAVA